MVILPFQALVALGDADGPLEDAAGEAVEEGVAVVHALEDGIVQDHLALGTGRCPPCPC